MNSNCRSENADSRSSQRAGARGHAAVAEPPTKERDRAPARGEAQHLSANIWIAATLVLLLSAVATPSYVRAEDRPDVLVIVGAPGEDEYAPEFAAAAAAWRQACEAANTPCTLIGVDDDVGEVASTPGDGEQSDDLARVRAWIEALPPEGPEPVWIAYIGHGTFDGREARLNLRGPDVSASELQTWLAPVRRPLVFVHGGSASGPFIPALSALDRVIVTATSSGDEVNYARFGAKFADSIADPAADLDQDGQTTVLEAYLMAARRVQDFYTEELRMATEHALLDDNGDKRGTPPDWFRGTRATKQAEGGASVDGVQAHRIALVRSAAERALSTEQRAERDRLEEELEQLRGRKAEMNEPDYWRELEILLRKIGAIYRTVAPDEAPEPAAPPPSPPADEPHAIRAPDS